MSLSDLIARLEKATGPHRELDLRIARAHGWRDCGAAWARPGETHSSVWAPPAFTASIEAALTLVPEGWEYHISNRAPAPHTGRAYVHNGEMQFIGGGMVRNPKYRGYETTASIPALALCIAALRAREVQP